jgi:A/G-specific adenine glycosylase
VKRIKYEAVLDTERRDWFRAELLRWFEASGRDLPWRATRDPYAVLVSEILLHQTTVKTVKPVYEKFLARFPTVEALASAPLAEVKAITDPLGYKIRGQWLKAIAEYVTTQLDGRWPETLEGWMALPGVGRYTAGAVLAFAFGQPAGVLDTNVARVITRFWDLGGTGHGADRLHRLWAVAEALVPPDAAWAFNQALMDLGATVCTARKPACLVCPVSARCPARSSDVRAAEAGEGLGVAFWERPRPHRRNGRA